MEKIEDKHLTQIDRELIDKANKVRDNAYAPYSKFKVGSALITDTEKIYTGCNVESVDLTLTTHAEMNAINSMIANGERKIKKIIIVMQAEEGYAMACGLCRQKILEFAVKGTIIIGVNLDKNNQIKDIFRTNIEELMPFAFGPDYLLAGQKKA